MSVSLAVTVTDPALTLGDAPEYRTSTLAIPPEAIVPEIADVIVKLVPEAAAFQLRVPEPVLVIVNDWVSGVVVKLRVAGLTPKIGNASCPFRV